MTTLLDSPLIYMTYEQRLHDDSTQEAMGAVGDLLDDVSYADLYAIVAKGDLYAPNIRSARERIVDFNTHDRAIVEFFALGLPVALGDMSSQMSRVVALLRSCMLVATPDPRETSSTRGFVVVPVLRGYLLVGTPPLYRSTTSIGASAYLGRDSITLAGSLPRTVQQRVLDLGAGCGVQGLLAAHGASEAVLTDIDPVSLELAACNKVLNNTQHPVRILQGDGYAPVAREQFDLIVALTPYVPAVEGSATSEVVSGGRDGLTLIRRFLTEAASHLAPNGEFVGLAQLLCNDHGPLLADELDGIAPQLDVRLSLTDWRPLQPYLWALATKLSEHGAPIDRSELSARYGASLRPLGVTGVCTAVIRLRRPRQSGTQRRRGSIGAVPQVRSIDIPALCEVAVSGDRQLTTITSTDGTVYALNGPTSALVQAIDGQHNIAELALAAWGQVDAAVRPDIEDQAISRLLDLAGTGLLEFHPPKG